MVIKLALAALALAARSQDSDRGVVAGRPADLSLEPAPINPEWILEGSPTARGANHSASSDTSSSTAVWECTAGKFRWFFYWDETVVILDGGVLVTDPDGRQHRLGVGDIAYFKAGTWSTWQVDDYVRKIAFIRRPYPKPLALLFRLRNGLRSLLRRTPPRLL